MNIPDGFFENPVSPEYADLLSTMGAPIYFITLHVATPAIVDTSIVMVSCCMTRAYSLTAAMSFLL